LTFNVPIKQQEIIYIVVTIGTKTFAHRTFNPSTSGSQYLAKKIVHRTVLFHLNHLDESILIPKEMLTAKSHWLQIEITWLIESHALQKRKAECA